MTDRMAKRRVKLYTLNAERQWDDRGTGHVTSTYIERLKGISLLVKGESDGALLLESRIMPETSYQRQQGTLIVWSEGDNYDLALSFQEKTGCEEIWEKICQVQGKDPSVDITQDVVEESEDERYDDSTDNLDVDLPACTVGTLDELNETISGCFSSQNRKEKLAYQLESEGYLKELVKVFQKCEETNNFTGLHQLYEIFKQIFHLNKNSLFEIMFSEDMIFHVVGALEYDPNLKFHKKHRQYLKRISNYKEVLPIQNEELLKKIHQTYRVQYIQDVVLPTPQVFEENILSTLSSFIFFNKVEIVNTIQEDEKFLSELFNQLCKTEDEELPLQKRRDLILFLKEFCTFSQTLQPIARECFFKNMNNMGILPAVEIGISMDDPVTKSAAIDVLTYVVEYSPCMVRDYMLNQLSRVDEDQFLMNIIIEQMLLDSDPEMGGAVQLNGILRIIIDPDNMVTAIGKPERTEFLCFIYKHSMHDLVAPVLSNTIGDEVCKNDYQTAQLLSLILELISFCVEHHSYHCKYYIVQRDLLKRSIVLLKSKHTFLALSALRLIRKIVGMKDDFYYRHIINVKLFCPIVAALMNNNGRYNLLDSALIELFEFIKTEKITTLLKHIIETYPNLQKIDYVQTFAGMKLAYDQEKDLKDLPPTEIDRYTTRLRSTNINDPVALAIDSNRFRRDLREMDAEEESWLNSDEEVVMDTRTATSTLDIISQSRGLCNTSVQEKANHIVDSPPSNDDGIDNEISSNSNDSSSDQLVDSPPHNDDAIDNEISSNSNNCSSDQLVDSPPNIDEAKDNEISNSNDCSSNQLVDSPPNNDDAIDNEISSNSNDCSSNQVVNSPPSNDDDDDEISSNSDCSLNQVVDSPPSHDDNEITSNSNDCTINTKVELISTSTKLPQISSTLSPKESNINSNDTDNSSLSTKKVSLVDYDENSDEEEASEESNDDPPPKRLRLEE